MYSCTTCQKHTKTKNNKQQQEKKKKRTRRKDQNNYKKKNNNDLIAIHRTRILHIQSHCHIACRRLFFWRNR
jgi:hypothetical protein